MVDNTRLAGRAAPHIGLTGAGCAWTVSHRIEYKNLPTDDA